ncbi:hypothetical protein SPHI_10450 [Sphingomonas jeddahensis]|uniref:Uncharacterized protein n=1 Tax=Sphingomonas jeddahensis TaxID=1915074 RepID=A0A1V2EVZ4_9SPHN|nr:hypothetical protein SPHI_10450 [Sphingomonas jeddahensis]
MVVGSEDRDPEVCAANILQRLITRAALQSIINRRPTHISQRTASSACRRGADSRAGREYLVPLNDAAFVAGTPVVLK